MARELAQQRPSGYHLTTPMPLGAPSQLLRLGNAASRVDQLQHTSAAMTILCRGGNDRRILRATRGRIGQDVVDTAVYDELEQLARVVACVAKKLSQIGSSSEPRVGSDSKDSIKRRQLLAFTASPIGDVAMDAYAPDFVGIMVSTLLMNLLLTGDINDQLFVLLLFHSECDSRMVGGFARRLGRANSVLEQHWRAQGRSLSRFCRRGHLPSRQYLHDRRAVRAHHSGCSQSPSGVKWTSHHGD